MKITFLGTSHGYDEPGRFCSSAVVTVNEKNYIIDAGAPIMGLLRTYGFEYCNTEHIFITHSHPDHYMGLIEFTSQLERFGQFSGVHFSVHAPVGFPYESMLNYLFGNGRLPLSRDESGRLKTQNDRVSFFNYPDEESVIFEDENIKITAIPNSHCAHSHSFLIEAEGKRVMFSGDLAKDFPDYPAVLTDPEGKKINLLILEGAHTVFNKPEVLDIMAQTRTQRLIVNHVNYIRNTKEVINEMRNSLSECFPVDESFDGMTVIV